LRWRREQVDECAFLLASLNLSERDIDSLYTVYPLLLMQKVNSLTTSLVLTLRKAVSLVLSVWWFSGFDSVGWGLVLGGSLVLRA
jgi:hypothetical protein